MKTFVDNNGKTWTININVATIKRVKDLLGVNLMEAITGDLITKLEDDVILFVDVLYCVCKQEADANNITDEMFGASLAGDALEQATEAFLTDLIDFFPAAKRQIFRKAFQKQKEAETMAVQKMDKKLESLDLEKIIENKLANI